jgi:hypothetical protein
VKTLAELIARLEGPPDDECWEWEGYRVQGGYGRVRLNGTKWLAHRAAWALANGPIPEGNVVRHTCDNPPCANPRHLLTGTPKDNMRDMRARGRDRYVRGAEHPAARLTPGLVREIRAATGTHSAVAERYGISRGHVSRIKAGTIWRSVA